MLDWRKFLPNQLNGISKYVKSNLNSKAVFVAGLIIGGIVGGLGVYGLSENQEESLEKPVSVYEVPNKKLVMSSYLFDLVVPENQFYKILERPDYLKHTVADILPREENRELYREVGLFLEPQNTIVVFPKFTEAAYNEPGFYTYYREECDEKCLTVKLGDYPPHYTASKNGFKVLTALGYESITDLDLHKNPEILFNYDKVIMLHNEYVTREMFDAITNHPNVIFVYPNAMYAEVEYDEEANTITLIRGHNYPETHIVNGFDWEHENTHPYEYDTDCIDWEFYEITNGYMLNCYPEFMMLKDESLLRMIKDL